MKFLLIAASILVAAVAVNCYPYVPQQEQQRYGQQEQQRYGQQEQLQFGQQQQQHLGHLETENIYGSGHDHHQHSGQTSIGGVKGGHRGHSGQIAYDDQYRHEHGKGGHIGSAQELDRLQSTHHGRKVRSLELQSERYIGGVKGHSSGSQVYGDRLREYDTYGSNIESGHHLDGGYGLNDRHSTHGYLDNSGQRRSQIYPDQYNQYNQYNQLDSYGSGRRGEYRNGLYVDRAGRVLSDRERLLDEEQFGRNYDQSSGRLIGSGHHSGGGVKGGRISY